jgi:UDPglucose 6-dehydrogenase
VIKVGFAGMTHLGINSAVATAARGLHVVGYDADMGLVDRLRRHDMPITEPDLDAMVTANAARLEFSADLTALMTCDVVYIAADVPTDDSAKSDLAPIQALIADVGRHLNPNAILVVLCQVPPGFTRSLTAVPHNRLFYQVETLIFGRAVDRALNPERFIIGCAAPEAPIAPAFHEVLKAFNCPILPMRYESAELAKIAINFCLVASVGVANTLAEVSEAIGADWSEIVPALKLDRRIGPFSYLSPGLGISGGNLERDLRTVLNIAEARNTDGGIIEAWFTNSQRRKDWCWQRLSARVLNNNPTARVAVLGLAYKENTASTKNSPALALLSHLKDADVCVHDPVVPAGIVPFAGSAKTPLECARGADALVLITPWPEYKNVKIADLAAIMRGRVIIDPYRLLDGPTAATAGFEYHTLGMPPLNLQA